MEQYISQISLMYKETLKYAAISAFESLSGLFIETLSRETDDLYQRCIDLKAFVTCLESLEYEPEGYNELLTSAEELHDHIYSLLYFYAKKYKYIYFSAEVAANNSGRIRLRSICVKMAARTHLRSSLPSGVS
jgi:hypothetical protein